MGDFFDKLTWECHICGEVREDSKISVLSKDTSHRYELPKGTLKENIRYCNDKQECIDVLKTKNIIK